MKKGRKDGDAQAKALAKAGEFVAKLAGKLHATGLEGDDATRLFRASVEALPARSSLKRVLGEQPDEFAAAFAEQVRSLSGARKRRRVQSPAAAAAAAAVAEEEEEEASPLNVTTKALYKRQARRAMGTIPSTSAPSPTEALTLLATDPSASLEVLLAFFCGASPAAATKGSRSSSKEGSSDAALEQIEAVVAGLSSGLALLPSSSAGRLHDLMRQAHEGVAVLLQQGRSLSVAARLVRRILVLSSGNSSTSSSGSSRGSRSASVVEGRGCAALLVDYLTLAAALGPQDEAFSSSGWDSLLDHVMAMCDIALGPLQQQQQQQQQQRGAQEFALLFCRELAMRCSFAHSAAASSSGGAKRAKNGGSSSSSTKKESKGTPHMIQMADLPPPAAALIASACQQVWFHLCSGTRATDGSMYLKSATASLITHQLLSFVAHGSSSSSSSSSSSKHKKEGARSGSGGALQLSRAVVSAAKSLPPPASLLRSLERVDELAVPQPCRKVFRELAQASASGGSAALSSHLWSGAGSSADVGPGGDSGRTEALARLAWAWGELMVGEGEGSNEEEEEGEDKDGGEGEEDERGGEDSDMDGSEGEEELFFVDKGSGGRPTNGGGASVAFGGDEVEEESESE